MSFRHIPTSPHVHFQLRRVCVPSPHGEGWLTLRSKKKISWGDVEKLQAMIDK